MATVVVTVKERIATIPSGVSLVCNNPNVNKEQKSDKLHRYMLKYSVYWLNTSLKIRYIITLNEINC